MRTSPAMLAAALPSLLTALLLACASSPPAPPAPPAPSAAPLASTSAEAPPSSASAAATEAPPAESPFVAVGEIPPSSSLFPVEGAMFVAAREPGHFGREPKEDEPPWFSVGVLREGKLDFPDRLRLTGWWERVEAVIGRWPDAIDMLAITDTGRTGMAEHYVLTSTGWDKKRGLCRTRGFDTVCESGSRYTGVQKIGDSLLTLEAPIMYGTPRFTTLRGPTVQRKLTPVRSCQTDENNMGRKSEVLPLAFGGLKDGSLVSYGETCKQETVIETWKPEGGEPTITPLPGAKTDLDSWQARFIHGPAGETLLLTGKIFRADSGAWKEIPLPEGVLIDFFSTATVAPDGDLWIAGEKGVFRRHQERWEAITLPAGLTTLDDLAAFDGQLWAAGQGTLLRLRRPGETGPGAPIRARNAATTQAHSAKKFARPGSPRCAQNLVLLYAFTKVTPDDYDFPLTRKALTGHTEFKDTRFVITRDGGKKFFSAQVASFDQGKKLVSLIEKSVKDSRPQLICAEPEVLREVKIDLRTGKTLP